MTATTIISVVALSILALWSTINTIVTLGVLATKQLIQADRGIAWYVIGFSFVALAASVLGIVQLINLSGILGG